MAAVEGVEVTGPRGDRYDEILTPDALRLLASLQRELGPRRAQLLAARETRQVEISPAAPSTSSPGPARSGMTRPGGWRRPRPGWWTAGWRSPARPSGR